MKHSVIFISLIFLSILGCSDFSNSPVDPISDNSNLDKQLYPTYNPDQPPADYELIPLPQKAPGWQDSVFTVSQDINGLLGGVILFNKLYVAADGEIVTILVDLVIPPLAFEGTKTISVTIDSNYAALHFYPSMTFDRPLSLTQTFSGLNLASYQTGTIDFAFIGDDGTYELVKKNAVQVIVPQGLVRVLNCKINHFSRYAWTRGPMRMNLDAPLLTE